MRAIQAAIVGLAAVGLTALAAGEAGKVPANPDARIEALGAARMRAMARMNDLPQFTDSSFNGLQAVNAAISQTYTRTQQALSKQIQDESAKAPEIRNQFLIDDLNARMLKLSDMWAAFSNKEWPAVSQRIGALSLSYQSLSQLVGNFTGMDGYWLRSNLDADVMTAVFVALEKRADEIKAQAQAVVADARRIAADWDAAWKDAATR